MTDGDDLERVEADVRADGSVEYARLAPGEAVFAYFSFEIPGADGYSDASGDAGEGTGPDADDGAGRETSELSNVASATCAGLGFSVTSEELAIPLAPANGGGGSSGGDEDEPGDEPTPAPQPTSPRESTRRLAPYR